ncbi:hypothetical protein TB15x_20590 [Xanthomonas perforans]|uniref:hypothetical protein n=1 Tax=Xanthomonas TaxID=338 RepID=UPI00062D5BB0|nr:hypothetical protein [Xanthomonas perforans]KLD35820.1 hypothetical protein TB15x_20590 [Xanthomonas perforans]MBZ2436259.1 hypothetical protein [Xanthomonas perforans]MBZ2461371.1 hypothetical protein [Xanthomonas perforans]MBZ2482797.1 hypothetical protein [Xanthomonas perforans]MBZ2491365.1 hypothetical protein [Xanthomonas perforans]
MKTDQNPQVLADALNAATRAGNLADAYSVIKDLPSNVLLDVFLTSGFSCAAVKNHRELLAYVVNQVADAARQKTDGPGLRAIARKAAH